MNKFPKQDFCDHCNCSYMKKVSNQKYCRDCNIKVSALQAKVRKEGKMLNKLLVIFVFISMNLSAQSFEFQSSLVSNPTTGNQLYLEPEFSCATYKTGNIKQKGNFYGIRAGYDLLIFNNPYIGFESIYRSGRIKGDGLSSLYTDYLFEGKIGFTIGYPNLYYFTPYAGLGYENEKNDYKTSPVDKLKSYYFSFGFITEAFITPQFSYGVNLKIKFPFIGDHKVKNNDINVNLAISKKMQYTLEVPFTYWVSSQINLSAVPFYDYKNYNNNSLGIEWNHKAKMHQWGLGFRGTFCF